MLTVLKIDNYNTTGYKKDREKIIIDREDVIDFCKKHKKYL